jgi:hypothetical protein
MPRVRKISAFNEFKSGVILYFAGGMLGAAIGVTVASLLGYPASNGIQYGAQIGLIFSTGIFLKWQISGRGWRWNSGRKSKKHSRQFASNLPWYVKEGIDDDGILRWYDRRDKPPEEFIFYGLDLPAKIPESMMYRFCRLALHRQEIVFDTERRTFKRNGRKLTSTEILSKIYFTRTLSPRFLPEQYDAIKTILELTGMWANHRAGHPGYLFVAHGTSPQKMVHRARWGWIDIVVRADSQQSQPFWKRPASPHAFEMLQ